MFGREAVFYAPLIRAKRQVGETLDETSDDLDMRDALRYVTSRIDKELKGRSPFIPIAETEYLTARVYPDGDVYGLDLVLPRPLLEITALANGDGTVITSEQYRLLPQSRPPYRRIRLQVDGSVLWSTAGSGETQQVIALQGVWGSREDYANQWLDSGDTVRNASGLNTSERVITVVDAEGDDAYMRTPRFSPGQVLRIGSEFMPLLKVDGKTQLTVIRQGLGTTAATHILGAPIYVYEVDPTIQQAAAIWASYAYKRRGRFEGTEFDTVSGIARSFPKDIPPEVAGILGLEANQSAAPTSIRIYKV